MGLFSGDKKISNEYVSNTQTTNVGFSDLGEDAVAISGNNNQITNVTTDNGAIQAATDFAAGVSSELSYVSGTAIGSVSDVSKEALWLAGDVNSQSLDHVTEFSGDALSAVAESFDDSLTAVSDFGEEGFDFGRDVIAETLGQIRESDELNHQLVEQALDYNQALIGESARSETATLTKDLIKNIPLVVGAIALIIGIQEIVK